MQRYAIAGLCAALMLMGWLYRSANNDLAETKVFLSAAVSFGFLVSQGSHPDIPAPLAPAVLFVIVKSNIVYYSRYCQHKKRQLFLPLILACYAVLCPRGFPGPFVLSIFFCCSCTHAIGIAHILGLTFRAPGIFPARASSVTPFGPL